MRRVLLLALLASTVAAQTSEPDTLDPRGYFPLAVGNAWEYRDVYFVPASPRQTADSTHVEHVHYRIVGEGAGAEGDRYVLVHETYYQTGALASRDTVLVRYDSTTASVVGNVRQWDGSWGEAPSPWFASCLVPPAGDGGCPSGGGAWAASYSQNAHEWPLPLFPEGTQGLQARTYFNLGGDEALAIHGVGFVRGSWFPDGCWIFCSTREWDLTYARVDGRVYGAHAIGVEASHPEAVRLAVYPNPAGSSVTVEVPREPGTAVTVYDVRGRAVLTAPVPPGGVVRLNVGTLPAGVYVVRAGERVGRLVVR